MEGKAGDKSCSVNVSSVALNSQKRANGGPRQAYARAYQAFVFNRYALARRSCQARASSYCCKYDGNLSQREDPVLARLAEVLRRCHVDWRVIEPSWEAGTLEQKGRLD